MSVGVRLRPPRPTDEAEVRAAQEELAADDFTFAFWAPGQPFADLVQGVDDHRHGRRLADGWVESTFLLAVVDATLVGRSSIRFELNDHLRHQGGHIGYAVRPAHRRRGYATEILRQSLVVARAGGVDDVLVTCDDDNIGSAAVIERCGGVLDGIVTGVEGVAVRRYWIA
jgi:predicted acetyltransferase